MTEPQSLEEAKLEILSLRSALSRSLAALGNGSGCGPHCSIDFLSQIPDEIETEVKSLRRQIQQLSERLRCEDASIEVAGLEILAIGAQRDDIGRSLHRVLKVSGSDLSNSDDLVEAANDIVRQRQEALDEIEIAKRYCDELAETISKFAAREIALESERDEARAEVDQLRWLAEASCENTPTKNCDCPGCCTARERADRGEA